MRGAHRIALLASGDRRDSRTFAAAGQAAQRATTPTHEVVMTPASFDHTLDFNPILFVNAQAWHGIVQSFCRLGRQAVA